jgi:acyl-CoA synthetase (AMP-forming)/AMP-acid ligase II
MAKPWLKYYDEGVPATIPYPAIPVDQLLSKAAYRHPDHPAIIFGARVGSRLMDAKLTYRQINDAANRFASSLQRMGVKKGDRVAIMAPSCPQFIIAFCRERMASYKAPRAVEFRTDLPKSLIGKVLRRVLREQELSKAG